MRLETERLTIRPWTMADAADIFAICGNPKIGPRAGWPAHQSIADSERVLRELFLVEGHETAAAIMKKDGALMGCISVRTTEEPFLDLPVPRLELGYWLGEDFWGQGYMPEAVQAVLAHCFQALNADEVYVGHFDVNDQSRRVIEKCGFSYVATAVRHCKPLDEMRTELFYKISREAWRALAA